MTFRLTLLAFGLAAAALAGPKTSADLNGLLPGTRVRVLVQYTHQPGPADLDRLAGKGATAIQGMKKFHAVAAELSVDALDSLANSAEVTYISADRRVLRAVDYTVAATGADVVLRY